MQDLFITNTKDSNDAKQRTQKKNQEALKDHCPVFHNQFVIQYTNLLGRKTTQIKFNFLKEMHFILEGQEPLARKRSAVLY